MLTIDGRTALQLALRVRWAEAEESGNRGEYRWVGEHLTEALQRFVSSAPPVGEHAGWDAALDELTRELLEFVADVEEGE